MKNIDKQDGKSVTLYDAGGWFLIWMIFGVGIVGVIIDYFWHYLIFKISLRRQGIDIPRKTKHFYCLIITALGLLIDWLYFEIAWGTLVLGPIRIAAIFSGPGSNPVLEILTILIPILLIAAVNAGVSRLLLKVKARQALAIGGIMGLLTAPWLIILFVVINW
jgi:hypothetical protein